MYYNEEGKVKLKRGESPIGDDPNDILKNDFSVNYYNKYSKEAYQKYCDLKLKINNETDTNIKNELISEIEILGDKYNF